MRPGRSHKLSRNEQELISKLRGVKSVKELNRRFREEGGREMATGRLEIYYKRYEELDETIPD